MPDPVQDTDQIPERLDSKFIDPYSQVTTLNFRLWYVFRFAEAEEMGGVVSFLVSEDASYITGENFLVAGGMNARLWKKGEAKRSLWREPEEIAVVTMSRDRLQQRVGPRSRRFREFKTYWALGWTLRYLL